MEQLFHMIDQDQSGTIEVAEFIGPLSRWAHDSKTAPRFIKYNMIQAPVSPNCGSKEGSYSVVGSTA